MMHRQIPMLARCRWIAALVVMVATAFVVPTEARADEDVLENSPVVRRQLQYRESRHEVSGVVGLSLSDPFVRNVLPGIRYDYHTFDWLSIGARVLVGIPVQTAMFESVDEKVARSNETFVMEATSLRFAFLAHTSVSPVVGKLLAFDSLPINFDIHFDLIAGVVAVGSTGDNIEGTGIQFTGGAGGGLRIFISKVLAFTADLQTLVIDRPMSVNRDSKAAGGKSRFNGLALVGLSFFMPPELTRAD